MKKLLSKSVFYTLMAFACFNLFMLTSCSEEAEKTETTTTETTTTTTTPPVESAAPKDSVTTTTTTTTTMDSANTKPVEAPVKK